jgi:mannose-6-phosphate isomerase-like protein (cupin superfamily)
MGALMDPIDIAAKLAAIDDHWNPRVIAELNGQQVKAVKFIGTFVWHDHTDEDELFLVVKGRFRMDFRDRSVWIEQGQAIVVPRGVEHRPHADDEVEVLLFEPASTINTGEADDPRRRTELERL